MDDRALLQVEGITSGYGRVEILHEVSLEVRQGTITCLIGPNGAGKSTVLKTIQGFLRPTQGRIALGGEEITGHPPHTLLGLGVASVPQGRQVFPEMTVLENLEMGAFTIHDRHQVHRALERVYALFPRLRERRHQQAGTLSGGEQQMLAIGRALMVEPKLVLMDEPSLGLAPRFVDQIFETIVALKRQGITILMVEQNAKRALAVADWGYVLELGKNRFEETGQWLLHNPEVRRMYLGG